MTAASAARTLADQLRGWPEDRVAALLRVRPDLACPPPQDSSQLAARAATRSSILPVLDRLDRATLHVLDALVITAPLPAARRTDPAELVRADPAAVSAGCRRLCDLALVWDSPQGLVPLTEVASVLAGSVSGLHPCSAEALIPEQVGAALAALGDEPRALLDQVASHGGVGTSSGARRRVRVEDAAGPVEELLSRGLLVSHDERSLRVPGEVGLVLQGGRTTSTPVDQPPAVDLVERDPATVDQVAAGAGAEVVRRVVALLQAWATAPPGVLRSGGLSVKDLRRTAEEWHTNQQEAALCLELAAAAGLLAAGTTTHGETAWLPTPAFDALAENTPAEQWSTLVRTWLTTTRSPGVEGNPQRASRARNVLGPDLEHPLAPTARREVLTELAGLPAGSCLASGTGLPGLVARLQWRRPRRRPPYAGLVEQAVREAAVLGLTARGGATSAARALVAEDPDGLVTSAGLDAAQQRIAALLPEPVDHVLLQADLTAVAPGPLTRELSEQLHQMADVESGGGASVHRFSADSLHRALHSGWTGTELHAFLEGVSRTPVPQPLSYRVDDAVRTFARPRSGPGESVVGTDDPATRAAPQQRARPRTAPDREHQAGGPAAASTEQVEAAVASLRAGDRGDSASPRTTTKPQAALAALRNAIEAGAPVRLRYVDNNGASSERTVDPWRVRGGVLTGHDHRSAGPREFAVHRIAWVRAEQTRVAPPPRA